MTIDDSNAAAYTSGRTITISIRSYVVLISNQCTVYILRPCRSSIRTKLELYDDVLF